MEPLLELKNISQAYHTKGGETSALSNLSFQVFPGEFLAIIGPSGCGKTTILSIIAGLIPAESGEVLYKGKPMPKQNKELGYMLQKDQLFEWRSIYKNVTLGIELQRKKDPESLSQVKKMLKEYGLEPFANARPSELSGGMRQRAALIRTLAVNPELLLLDEPFSALDYQTRLSVCDDIASIIKKENKTAILVTHDLSEAISVADRVIVLSSRPATVRRIVPISVSIPDRTPMRTRNAPEFKDYFNLLWKELNHHE